MGVSMFGGSACEFRSRALGICGDTQKRTTFEVSVTPPHGCLVLLRIFCWITRTVTRHNASPAADKFAIACPAEMHSTSVCTVAKAAPGLHLAYRTCLSPSQRLTTRATLSSRAGGSVSSVTATSIAAADLTSSARTHKTSGDSKKSAKM